MEQYFTLLSTRFGVTPEILVLAGIGLGAAVFFISLAVAIGQRNPAAERIAETRMAKANARFDRGLLRETVRTPKGLLRAALPTDEQERLKIEQKFRRAGITSPNALRVYTLVRIGLGVLLPLFFAALVVASKTPGMPVPEALAERLAGLNRLTVIQIIAVAVAVGYYLPAIWLDGRVKERQLRITESFPNALDLLQVSIEAGLGFDAAMTRVANELAAVSPDIAFEFLTVQHQVAAGRPREVALQAMARNTGVDMVRSFSTVIVQSMHFGTSMAEALTTYAHEMRIARELKAQEMANKLPVKMSAVLASLMLPAVVIVTIGPVVIRYIRVFSG
ncbi:type II secretion system F family protein [Marimonas arenosa]|uniref:Type II secretion system F family protein n=1 Tax=Marimonas arenosa TaxID=1795305 RepID=A0AAE4B5V2_9RHOB|nr:type II secretion system F family protein [Marimonas arenosa]MDQ2089691.1 type II secretion system F family protein [Marimonas arenosa]